MDKKEGIILQVLINHYHSDGRGNLSKFLSRNEKNFIEAFPVHSANLVPLFKQPASALADVHYSWLKPIVEAFDTSVQPMIVSSLTTTQQAGFKISAPQLRSQSAKSFILGQLYAGLQMGDHLPLEYLPETALSPLLVWSKHQIMQLIDFLGIHDLAAETRRILNRDALNAIYSALSPKQLHYLKKCLHQKDKIVSPKLGIDPSTTPEQLKKLLHRRGLLRFGRAFYGEHPDFVWHIAHRLDTGRGKMILNEYQPKALPGITSVLKQQVLDLMNFLKSE